MRKPHVPHRNARFFVDVMDLVDDLDRLKARVAKYDPRAVCGADIGNELARCAAAFNVLKTIENKRRKHEDDLEIPRFWNRPPYGSTAMFPAVAGSGSGRNRNPHSH